MRKRIVGVAAAVALVVAAAFVIPLAIPTEVYKARLVALVKQATGRELSINGPVSFSLWPAPTIEAREVSLGNGPRNSTLPIAELRALQARLRLWPLFSGRVVVDRLVLIQPRIMLEIDRSGHPNWAFGPTAASEKAGAAAQAAFRLSGFGIEQMRVVDGTVGYLDQRTGSGTQLDNIALTASLGKPDGPLNVVGSTGWRGERVDFALEISTPRAFLAGGGSAAKLDLTAPPLTLVFSGRFASLPQPELAGAVEIKSRSLRELARWAGIAITTQIGGLGPFAVRSAISVAGTRVSLGDADLSLDAIRAKGSVAIDTARARPFVTGNLVVNSLDLDPYLSPPRPATGPPPTAKPAPSPSPAGHGNANDAALTSTPPSRAAPGSRASPFTLADLDLGLTIGSIAYRKFRIGATQLGLTLTDGRLVAALRRMALYGGNGTGRITVDGAGPVPSIGLDLALSQVQIGPLAAAAVDNNRLSGTANLDITLTARNQTRENLIASLSGRGGIGVSNGEITGVDLLALADNAARIERQLIGMLDVTGALNLLAQGSIKGVDPLALAATAVRGVVGGNNTTRFATLSATCTVADGVVRNDDLRLTSGLVPLTGAGTIDLRTHAVDYRLNLKLAGDITVPIIVGGTWDNPTYRPDMAAMLAETPANAIAILKSGGAAVGRNLKGIGQGLQNFGRGAIGTVKGLLGK